MELKLSNSLEEVERHVYGRVKFLLCLSEVEKPVH